MEEILQILIFVGAMVIAVVGQNAKNKKKPQTASPQEVLEDMFPDIETDQETPIAEPQPAPQPKPVFKRKPRHKACEHHHRESGLRGAHQAL